MEGKNVELICFRDNNMLSGSAYLLLFMVCGGVMCYML